MPAQQTAPDLLGALRKRQAQAREVGAAYLAPVAERDTMLFWLAEAAKQARATAGRKQVHVAASADMDQSSIWRFEEKRAAWPRNTDMVIGAYAEDLDIDPLDLWETAIQLWRADRAREPQRITDDGQGLALGATKAGEGLRGGTQRPPRAASKRSPKGNPRA